VPDHTRYEELTALAAAGLLSDDELAELHEHLSACPDCRKDVQELRNLFRRGFPLTRGFSNSLKAMNDQPDAGAFGRFLARAGSAGLRISRSSERSMPAPRFRLGYLAAFAGALAALVLAAILYVPALSRHEAAKAERQGDVAKLATQLAARDQELASLQRQLRDLNVQLGNALKTAETYRREGQQKGVQVEQSTSKRVQLQDELQNGEKQLQAANEEIARIKQLRATDKASLDAQRLRIREISDQLRVADATLDMEQQLSAEGKDIRELLVARQLRVVDVRDMDDNGKPAQTFGRVFLTEGKSLMFFAFDLNDAKGLSGRPRYQVWGELAGKKGSAHSLGVLSIDDKAQNRWALRVENPALLKDVNYVYVTTSSSTGENNGQRMLYAFLGEPGNTPSAN
jgi:hypothetical protein